MAFSVLCSLALMLQMFSSLLHLIALASPAWVQLGVFVPLVIYQENAGAHNASSMTPPLYSMVDYNGPRVFVKVKLGLWEWCQQFQQMSSSCINPEFLSGVELLEVVALFTLPLSLLLMAYTGCLDMDSQKKRVVTLSSLLLSILSAVIVSGAVATYAVLSKREVTHMLTQIGEDTRLPYLGWAFGADAVACVLVCVAAICIGIDYRKSSKTKPKFQLMV